METLNVFGTTFTTSDHMPLPRPDNDNLELMTGCRYTPAELMQWIRRERKRLSGEVATDARLWTCPKHRRDWLVTLGLEQVTLWKCFGIWRA
jgi:hypothetical protein